MKGSGRPRGRLVERTGVDPALIDRLGGWLKEAMPFRGKAVACYHKEWDYFSREYGLPCVDYIEPKPGIPPTPGHVLEIINEMREQHIQVLLSTNYYDRSQVLEVAQKTGAKGRRAPEKPTRGTPVVDLADRMVGIAERRPHSGDEHAPGFAL